MSTKEGPRHRALCLLPATHVLFCPCLLQVQVMSQSAAGTSTQVQAGTAFTYQTATPGMPSGLAATASGLVSFAAPTSSGASSIEGYQVVAVPVNGGANLTVSGNSTSLQLGGLVDGQNYTVHRLAHCTAAC